MLGNEISSAREPAGAPVQGEASPRRCILVVEDEPVVRRMNASALQRAGYQVDTAKDGAFAWELLGSRRYDLMITDNNMPRLTGVELIEKLFAAHMALPFIMASGTMPETEFIQHPWLQPAATLLKPYTVEELLGAVEKVLQPAGNAATGSQVSGGCDSRARKITQTVEPAGAPVRCRTSLPRRILVVEDEPDLRRLNVEVLESSGYEVDTAADGLTGWKALHAARHAPESYALLITSHDMPGFSGMALVKKLRAARMALPVIMATRIMPAEVLTNRYPWLKPVATLVKPYSIEQLLGTVETVLRTADGVRAESALPPNPPGLPSADGLQL
jgi:two-component system chemotaxis response regulator CheY